MKTILLIEDHKNIRENLTEALELKGYNILVADNGRKGIELAAQLIPHLIICDVLMHDLDGYAVLKLLRENSITKKIPFIFSTSMSTKTDREAALKLGADDWIIVGTIMAVLSAPAPKPSPCAKVRTGVELRFQ